MISGGTSFMFSRINVGNMPEGLDCRRFFFFRSCELFKPGFKAQADRVRFRRQRRRFLIREAQ